MAALKEAEDDLATKERREGANEVKLVRDGDEMLVKCNKN